MKITKFQKTIVSLGAVGLFFFSGILVFQVKAQGISGGCVGFPHDVFTGSRDSSVDGSVRLLQLYLIKGGYLKAASTGYFGPATTAAVKDFQKAHGITVTGGVGDLTRAAILQASCPKPVSVTSSTSSVSPSTSNTLPTVPVIRVTVPQAGAVLTESTPYTIQWSGKAGTTFNVLLEDMSGAPQGFITSNIHANQYVWKVGDVFSSRDWASKPLSPGIYRIHVEDAATGAAVSDQSSGSITLLAAPISLKYIIPSSAPADGATSVVLYGSGFDIATTIYLDTQFIHPLYITSDGRALIFNVPPNSPTGVRSVKITNTYSSAPTVLTLTVTTSQ